MTHFLTLYSVNNTHSDTFWTSPQAFFGGEGAEKTAAGTPLALTSSYVRWCVLGLLEARPLVGVLEELFKRLDVVPLA